MIASELKKFNCDNNTLTYSFKSMPHRHYTCKISSYDIKTVDDEYVIELFLKDTYYTKKQPSRYSDLVDCLSKLDNLEVKSVYLRQSGFDYHYELSKISETQTSFNFQLKDCK